jgi:putative RecB family exonuclease
VGDDPVRWEPGEEAEEKQTGWRLVETYIRESNIPANSKPEAVEVPVEADLHQHGLPTLIGVLDLVQAGKIIDYKTIGQTPNAEKVAHTNEVQTSGYAVLYRESTGKRETGIELHHLVKLKNPKLVITALDPMNEHQQTRLFHLMEAYVDGLERRDFVPSPGLQCASCEFFNECRKWH